MFRPLSLYIGLRYTGARARNSFISVITLISALGLMLGVTVLITVLSVMNGFDRELQTRILGMVTHVSIHGREAVEDWQRLETIAKRHEEVIGVAPFRQLEGMLSHQGRVSGVFVSGIDPVLEPKVSIVGDFMEDGSLDTLVEGEFNIVLGYGLARQIGAKMGDKITLVLPEATLSPAGVMPRFRRFTVTGIFRVRAEVDALMAYINIGDAGRLAREPGKVEGIHIRLSDLFDASRIGWQLEQEVGPGFYSSDWTRTHGNLFQAIRMEKTMMTLLLSFIVAVAAFNIISSQVMLVTEKRANIAVMRTMGATPAMIMRIFMIQGTLIGVTGTALGTLLGVLLATNISSIGRWLEDTFQAQLFDAYFVNYLPSELQWGDVITIVAIAVGISFVATIIPARRASRVDPAEALRYE